MKKINKIIALAILTIISIITLSGCGYGEKEGTIVDKKYTAAHTTHSVRAHRVGKITTTQPYTIHHPERYELYIEKEDEGKTKGCWIIVTKEEYESYQIGDYYGEKDD